MKRFSALGLLVVTIGGNQCERRPESLTFLAESYDSAGVARVANGLHGAWGDARGTLEEVLRVGKQEGDPRYLLFNVSGASLSTDRFLIIGNRTDATVRIYDPGGTFVTEFGGRGDGPGEFAMVNRVQLYGDSIIVTDWQRGGKTTVFDRRGELLQEWKHTRPEHNMRVSIHSVTAGLWLGTVDTIGLRPDLDPGTEVVRLRTLYAIGPDGLPAAEVLQLPPRKLYGDRYGELDAPLFMPSFDIGVDHAGHVFVVQGERYEVDVYDASTGALLRRVSRAFEPRYITDDDLEELKAAVTSVFDTMHLALPPGATIRDQRVLALARVERRSAFPRLPYLPPPGRILVAPTGEFWIERRDQVSPAQFEVRVMFAGFNALYTSRATNWDVFDSRGVLLGMVTVPARIAPLSVTADRMVAVHKDELDVEYVVVYRLVPPVASAQQGGAD